MHFCRQGRQRLESHIVQVGILGPGFTDCETLISKLLNLSELDSSSVKWIERSITHLRDCC